MNTFDLPFTSVPILPETLTFPPDYGKSACPWLDNYIELSRKWSPRAYDGFHEACGIWVLSTVAARRVVVHMGKPRFTNLYINLNARTSLYAKSTTAEIALNTIRNAGLSGLLAPDNSTPQKFISDLTRTVNSRYDEFDNQRKEMEWFRLAFAGQRGWFYEEFGQHIDAMMRESGIMADFRGLLRRFDDTPERYENATISRGNDVVEYPYLALLASMTPADLKRHARKGSSLWGDGFLARFALVTPLEDTRSRARFPAGERQIPNAILLPLVEWNKRLGIPKVEIRDVSNNGNSQKTEKRAIVGPFPQLTLALSYEVEDAFYAYNDALLDIIAESEVRDLDGNYARFAEKALRVSALLAGVTGRNQIDLVHWARAQEIAECWRAGLHRLYAQINEPPPSRDMENEEKILSLISKKADPTLRELVQYTRLSYDEVGRTLNNLLKANVIQKRKRGKTEVYMFQEESVET